MYTRNLMSKTTSGNLSNRQLISGQGIYLQILVQTQWQSVSRDDEWRQRLTNRPFKLWIWRWIEAAMIYNPWICTRPSIDSFHTALLTMSLINCHCTCSSYTNDTTTLSSVRSTRLPSGCWWGATNWRERHLPLFTIYEDSARVRYTENALSNLLFVLNSASWATHDSYVAIWPTILKTCLFNSYGAIVSTGPYWYLVSCHSRSRSKRILRRFNHCSEKTTAWKASAYQGMPN